MKQDAPRPHILVVDDDEEHCELMEIRLSHHGFRVSYETTCRGALEVIEREVVDAMLLDLQLEDENGLDFMVRVLERVIDLPIVILTAHGTIDTAVEAMNRGAYGFLTKPFDDHELVQKLVHGVEKIRLRREVEGLRRIVGAASEDERLLGASAAIESTRALIARVAPTEATVLVLGESGSGKELAARTIHATSPRASAPFVAINCGALPPELLESELFGHKRGAFTGALKDHEGLFAAAHGGTLFLDEIGDAPPGVQVKLLRVLQERSYLPVGSTEPKVVDVRVVAATNRDLHADIESGRFREDLFYRLHVLPVTMPPLRERKEDIPMLAELFLTRTAAQYGKPSPHLSHEALRVLVDHDWPGNVRELANVVHGAALLCTDGVLRPHHVFAVMPSPREGRSAQAPSSEPSRISAERLAAGSELPPLREARETFDRAYLVEALRRTRGNVSMAAKMARRNRTDFYDLLRRYDIQADDFRRGDAER